MVSQDVLRVQFDILTSTHQTGAFPPKIARIISVSNPLHGILPTLLSIILTVCFPRFVTTRLHPSTIVALVEIAIMHETPLGKQRANANMRGMGRILHLCRAETLTSRSWKIGAHSFEWSQLDLVRFIWRVRYRKTALCVEQFHRELFPRKAVRQYPQRKGSLLIKKTVQRHRYLCYFGGESCLYFHLISFLDECILVPFPKDSKYSAKCYKKFKKLLSVSDTEHSWKLCMQ